MYDRQTHINCSGSATHSVLYVSFIHSVDLSEFISTYDYMCAFHSVCLISGMSHDHVSYYLMFFLCMDDIGSTVFSLQLPGLLFSMLC